MKMDAEKHNIDKTFTNNTPHPQVAYHYPHTQHPPIVDDHLHHCHKETEITRLQEKVKTLFLEHDTLNQTLADINQTQLELLKQVTNLSSIINTLKWTMTIMVAIFGGLFVFLISEVIKIIH